MTEVSVQAAPLAARSALGTMRDQSPQTVCDWDRLRIVEEPFLNIVSLRRSRRLPDSSAMNRWLGSLGLSLPPSANGLSGDAELGCCWFEPHAWLVTAASPVSIGTPEAGVLATRISDRLAAFRLTGPAAAQVIAAGCDPSILKRQTGARTRFAGFATVLIQQWGEDDHRLLIDVGLARSFSGWLLDASRSV